ncbi:hypothetical protein DPMN_145044 [Dreissena polymorpha]|uniref:Uncharacterized protein n=1 Tax=Dreissena polymorpha TaxID=45954 RepID=A0A9D4IX45_DREPO|nr:hypothetical protein DPMN_145044 [Dreissena polymorpha]
MPRRKQRVMGCRRSTSDLDMRFMNHPQLHLTMVSCSRRMTQLLRTVRLILLSTQHSMKTKQLSVVPSSTTSPDSAEVGDLVEITVPTRVESLRSDLSDIPKPFAINTHASDLELVCFHSD